MSEYSCYSNRSLLVAVQTQPGKGEMTRTTITNTPDMAAHDEKGKIRQVR